MTSKIDYLRNNTYFETVELLQKHKRAAIVRPTGFGKTGILTRLIHNYKKVLYLYPTEIIRDAVLLFWYGSADKIPEDRNVPNVTFMTYMAVANLSAADDNERQTFLDTVCGTDLIICDECHRIGASGTSYGLDFMLRNMPNVHMVGATATPERMDTIDEIARYFDDRMVSEYTLHDAFQDKILKKPYYFYFSYLNADKDIADEEAEAREEISKVEGAGNRLELAKKLRAAVIQISELRKMPHVIKSICHKYAPDENYMRFVAFFSSFEEVDINGEKLQAWFREAYPSYTIRTIRVTSESDETRENAKAIKNMKPADRTIDLILSCNMMNMGYHVNSLTGVVMYRGTQSGIIYTQQLGRVLSSDSDNAGIVFDLVDNLHTESMYQVLGRPTGATIWKRKRLKALKKKKDLHEAAIAAVESGADADMLEEAFPDLTRTEIEDIISNPDPGIYEFSENDEKELRSLTQAVRNGHERRSANYFEPEDLIAVSNEATYHDLIKKTVAEAKSMRCRQAWARWLEEGGQALAVNGRPLSQKEVLAQLPPENIPLPPFCKAKEVSVNEVLKEMHVPEDE